MRKAVKIISLLAIVAILTVPAYMALEEEDQKVQTTGISETSEKGQNDEENKGNLEERLKDAIVLYIGSPRAIVDNIEKQVDPDNGQVVPFIKNGRTLVPVRFISENMGAEVGWEASTSTVTVEGEGKFIQLVIGSKTMKVGSEEIELDVAPEIFENRTYLPLRSLAEALGKEVFYDRGHIVISNKKDIFNVETEKDLIDEIISKVTNLPRITSYEELEELVKSSRSNKSYYLNDDVLLIERDFSDDAIAAEPSASQGKADEAEGGSDYSTTNVQVQGVDEADIVKTDGEYIYQVNKNRIVVAQAYPYDKMSIVSMLNFEDKNFVPMEIYIDGDRLVVIGTSYEDVINSAPLVEKASISPYYPLKNTVKAVVFDVSDKSNIKNIRSVEIEGNYISSRKIGSNLYLVANKYIDFYYLRDDIIDGKVPVPSYRDTLKNEEYIELDCTDIRYFPKFVQPQYMTIAAFDIKSNEKAYIEAYLGAGENIYASGENLYVAVTKYNYDFYETPALTENAEVNMAPMRMPDYEDGITTNIYKFSLNEEIVTYLSSGEVPGTILNQFSMDEYKGYFRIATTTGNTWGTGENASKNNIYILDEAMNIAGKIEGIAPNERIYSVRFMGDRGYMVTFRQMDPFFVVDLEDPYNPKVLGELKIPGFSDYLHPYDENHIIGFGKDTVEMGGGVSVDGMKIALFDVTDVNNPVQKFSEIIGDTGTDSELLRNHKALLFSKDKNLLAFPISVMENGMPVFQGAYVYNIDEENGFVFKGKITHLTSIDFNDDKAFYYYTYDKHIERILYIDDTLYTLSKGMIKANDIKTIEEKNQLVIPK